MRRSRTALAVLLVATAAFGANYDYGTTAELKGVTKLYVDAADAVDLRNIMLNVLRKRLPSVQIADSESDADVSLVFTFQQLGRKSFVGELLAVKANGDKLRLLAKYRHDEEELNDLADEIVKQFIKDYKRVN